MSNEIFGVDIAAVALGAFAGNLHPLTLYKMTSTIGDFGEPVQSATTYPGEGVRLAWDSRLAIARGYPLDAVKILILQNGLPTPVRGDQIEILGDRWRVIDIRQDPVNATWSIAGVLDAGAPPSSGSTPPAANEFVLTWGD